MVVRRRPVASSGAVVCGCLGCEYRFRRRPAWASAHAAVPVRVSRTSLRCGGRRLPRLSRQGWGPGHRVTAGRPESPGPPAVSPRLQVLPRLSRRHPTRLRDSQEWQPGGHSGAGRWIAFTVPPDARRRRGRSARCGSWVRSRRRARSGPVSASSRVHLVGRGRVGAGVPSCRGPVVRRGAFTRASVRAWRPPRRSPIPPVSGPAYGRRRGVSAPTTMWPAREPESRIGGIIRSPGAAVSWAFSTSGCTAVCCQPVIRSSRPAAGRRGEETDGCGPGGRWGGGGRQAEDVVVEHAEEFQAGHGVGHQQVEPVAAGACVDFAEDHALLRSSSARRARVTSPAISSCAPAGSSAGMTWPISTKYGGGVSLWR